MLAEGKEMVCLGCQWVSHCWFSVRPAHCKMKMCYSSSMLARETLSLLHGRKVIEKISGNPLPGDLAYEMEEGFSMGQNIPDHWNRHVYILDSHLIILSSLQWGERSALHSSVPPSCLYVPPLRSPWLSSGFPQLWHKEMNVTFDRDIQRWQNTVSSWVAFLAIPYPQTRPVTHAAHLPFSSDGRNQDCVFVSMITIAAPSPLVWLWSLQSLLSLSIIKIWLPDQPSNTPLPLLAWISSLIPCYFTISIGCYPLCLKFIISYSICDHFMPNDSTDLLLSFWSSGLIRYGYPKRLWESWFWVHENAFLLVRWFWRPFSCPLSKSLVGCIR